ncbi:hypothetical protein KUTeg_008734 [Tegillarca granosa]|uniref:Golgin subfamily A member 4 n=1 Tax=Tegillarca granosa TaxID=220873 RepID=A0ABQ9FET2_TEGGR|nr:hypothetical protein KUTeg_008734 [Tegillarca granosa]
MFKSLKKKIEQGVSQTGLRNALSPANKEDERTTPQQSPAKPLAESTPKTDHGNENHSATPGEGGSEQARAEPPTGLLVDIPLQEETLETTTDFASALSSLPGNDTPQPTRSRTSSISSVTSDSFFANTSIAHQHYQLPSDIESEIEEQSTNYESYSKEDLYSIIKRYERRALKYKSKFMEIGTIYKDLLQERDKIKNTLTQSQDRAFRRISELKEQIQLDMLAKKDLEDNYRLMLEEKDEHIKVFQTQVRLLKEGKEIPEELEQKLKKDSSKKTDSAPTNDSSNEEIKTLNEKVKRLESLLNRCKETIKGNKEKITQLTEEKQTLQQHLEEKNSEMDKIKGTASPENVNKLQRQMKEARKVIEQLETDREIAIAEVKKQVHEEMELKDQELAELKQQCQLLQENNKEYTERIEKLEKSSQEKLEKSREIIKKMKEDKKQALTEMEERIKAAEKTMEEEKEILIQELSRAKQAAVTCLKDETEKQMSENVRKVSEERDQFWQKQLEEQTKTYQESMILKEKERETVTKQLQDELNVKLQDKEEEMRLAMEERDLQKMAALLQQDSLRDELQLQVTNLNSVLMIIN